MHHRAMVLSLIAASIWSNGVQAAPENPDKPRAGSHRLTLCRSGKVQPVSSPDLRPESTASCPYDQSDMDQRIAGLVTSSNRILNVERAQYQFGIPRMTSSYDSDREASYTTTIQTKDGSNLRLWVREAAYPLNAKPAAFTPGIHPQRIVPVDKLDVRFDITIARAHAQSGLNSCMTAADLADLAMTHGWKDKTFEAGLGVTDGGPAAPHYETANGRSLAIYIKQAGRMPTRAEMQASCVSRVTFFQKPLTTGDSQ